ncbi:TPA: polysaccharide pyruvyl transferase family protein [Serratia fonticola]
MNVLLIGYYGRENIGDDLMLSNLCRSLLKDNSIKITIAVHDVDKLKIASDIKNINLVKTSDKLSYVKAIFSADKVIWGGGTCFYDAGVQNNRGLYDLIKIGLLCKLFRTQFIFMGVGIGYLSDNVKDAIVKILKLSNEIYFRDKESLELARKLYTKGNFKLSGDLAFLNDSYPIKDIIRSNNYISYSGVQGYGDAKTIAEKLNIISKEYDKKIVFLPSHRGVIDDNDLHEKIAENLTCEFAISSPNSVDEYIDVLEKSYFHVGVRLHSVVLADVAGCPNVGIVYSPKVERYIRESGAEGCIRTIADIGSLTPSIISDIIDEYVQPLVFIDNQKRLCQEAIDNVFK